LHEGTEKVQAGKGLVKALRHHTFAAARPLSDDDAVFSEMGRELVSLAATGACATLFMLGMTGSGTSPAFPSLIAPPPSAKPRPRPRSPAREPSWRARHAALRRTASHRTAPHRTAPLQARRTT